MTHEFKVKDHESSFLPEGNWKLVWSDEFDGKELDRTKWDYRMSMMGQEWPAWTDQGVELDGNSNCVFKIMLNEEGKPVSSQLQTGYNYMDQPTVHTTFGRDELQWQIGKLHENLYTHKYGYYECRCRLQQMKGWWSAFWMQSPMIGATLDPAVSGTELDIMECFDGPKGRIAPHNAITGGYGLDNVMAHDGGVESSDPAVFHRYGMKWDETGYTFYVDGVENGHVDKYVSHVPEFILISTEVGGYRLKDRKPSDAAYEAVKAGDTFLVDYVRVFDAED